MKRIVSLLALLAVFAVPSFAASSAPTPSAGGPVIAITMKLAGPAMVFQTTITALSCSRDDVQAALTAAVAGSTVVIPPCPGGVSWVTPVTWTAPPNVTLKGAGTSVPGGGDQTVIIDSYASTSPLLTISTSAAGTFRATGFTVKGGNSGGQIKYGGILAIGGHSKKLRIDHVHINVQSYAPVVQNAAIRFTGHINGVVDHSIFDLHSVGNGIQVWFTGYNGANDVGDTAFAAPTGFGSSDFVFVEDNVFNANSPFSMANDCMQGGKMVFRHNVVNGAQTQTHPTSSGSGRGCRATELYLNKFVQSDLNRPSFNVFWQSAGPSLVWGNDSTGYVHFQTLQAMRRSNATYAQAPTPEGYGYAGTSFNGVGSNWDGNLNPLNGYPNLDQAGRGKSDLITLDFPNKINATTGCDHTKPCAWPRQALEPVYQWLNNWTPVPGYPAGAMMDAGDVHVENRDFYLHKAVFNGSFGVGSGPLLARPSVCTAGVGYWGIDTNTLYTCVSANVWAAYYTPYRYPHDLVSGDTAPPIPPIPPVEPPVPPTQPPVPPTVNKPPVVLMKTPTQQQEITVKSFTVSATLSDDVDCLCVASAEIYINGVLSTAPKQGVSSISMTWNTSPYKGKGPVTIKVIARDAEGLVTEDSRTVTVKK